jgi:hypothetical protein
MLFCTLTTVIRTISLSVLAAPPLPDTQSARDAVKRALPYIEKVATAWMQERKCNSCHNITFLVWSHNLAAARGFDVDRTKLADWTKWSLADSLSDRLWFKLRPSAMDLLRADGLAEDLLSRLKPLEGTTYLAKQDYLQAVEKAVGRESLALNRDLFLRAATLPNNGGGPDTLSQLLLGRAGSTSGRAESETYDAIRSLLHEWQEPDGTWEAQGQLPSLKWEGEKEMHEATTMWCLLAISAGNRINQELVRGTETARRLLKRDTPTVTAQSFALRLVTASRLGESRISTALRKELLDRQNADGGWGWVKDSSRSDAFATGQVLYALGLLGRDVNDPVVGRAWGFLLRTQDHDGSWQVPQEAINTRARSLNVYTYWGTAWATIGILQTLPGSEPSHKQSVRATAER